MKTKDVKIGEIYLVKVSGKLVRVKIHSECPYGGWWGTSLSTKRQIRIRTAGRLRRDVARDEKRLPTQQPPSKAEIQKASKAMGHPPRFMKPGGFAYSVVARSDDGLALARFPTLWAMGLNDVIKHLDDQRKAPVVARCALWAEYDDPGDQRQIICGYDPSGNWIGPSQVESLVTLRQWTLDAVSRKRCERCGEPVEKSWDHLVVSEGGEYFTCQCDRESQVQRDVDHALSQGDIEGAILAEQEDGGRNVG